jgi:hypothetical protein
MIDYVLETFRDFFAVRRRQRSESTEQAVTLI